ncbi:peptidylprolyl isomerase [Undibacterium squillarum]|uniref:Peptidyl-prolyl cis-trans isomerase n=1 Tax=Undibacterium squillarum TaxID=1131567 RepID=A0ABQ2XRA8_9BURK|nr:peptidylprolyl isomerase [Undibacterium squillarum]GGX29150.1 hypothetical protein GCM10010946_02430 [Undibacterium squillarum]
MKASVWILSGLAAAALLSACGGNKSDTPTVTATVSSVSIDPLSYRKLTTITINGQNLDKGINILSMLPNQSTACLNLTEVAGGTATKRTFTCKVVGLGNVVTTITDTLTKVLYQATQTSSLALPPQVTMVTDKGTVVIELNPYKAPVTVDNFLNYVESGFYPSKIFHRVEAGLVIQGGGYTKDLVAAATNNPIKLETAVGLSNTRGTIGLARTSDPNSGTSQFYFNLKDNSAAFDYQSAASPGYAVFGQIVSGLDVMDAIAGVPVSTQNGMSNVPVTPVLIQSVKQTQ